MTFPRQKILYILLILNIAILAVIVCTYRIQKHGTGESLDVNAFNLFFSIFYCIASISFLMLWLSYQGVSKGIPYSYRSRWLGYHDFEDDTMLFFAAAIILWQCKNALSFFEQNPFWGSIISNSCSTINSAIFLHVTTCFRFIPPTPNWIKHPFLERWFQQPSGIWYVASLFIGLTVILAWQNVEPIPLGIWKIKTVPLADTIFSLIVAFFLFRGLWRLFGEREMSWLRFLIIANLVLMLGALTLNLMEIESTKKVAIINYVNVGYKMSLITLSFALVITYHSSLRKLILDEKHRELKILRREVSHRVKNHLQTLISSIGMQLSKYRFSGSSEVISELHAVQSRVNAILATHELLYHPDPEEADLFSIELKEYLEELLSRLNDSFSFLPNCFDYHITLSPKISVKASIAPQIGMLITELALNVNQHAYLDVQSKYINIEIAQEGELLLIMVKDRGQGLITTTQNERIGHGLSIVQAITEQFRGTFQLQESHPGTQADISFSLKNLS